MSIVTLALLSEWTRKRKKLIIGTTIGLLLSGGVASQAFAIYQVHDSKVYMQIVEQIKKAQEQIAHLKAQYDLQLKNMQDFKKENIDPVLKDIGVLKNEYEQTRNDMDKLWSTSMKTPDLFRRTFEDIKNINVRGASYSDINNTIDKNRDKLDKLNQEVIILISKKQEELEKSNKRIAEMTALIQTTKGEKAIADLQAHIAAENVRAGNIASEIQSLQTKQSAIKAQYEKMEKDASEKMKEKVADDFKKAGEEMQTAADNITESSTLDPASQAAERMGWKL